MSATAGKKTNPPKTTTTTPTNWSTSSTTTPKPKQNDDYPIETLQAIIARVKLDISLHQKDAVEIRALQARYTKWPKIHASFNDEIETTERAILTLEDRLANYEQELAEELAKNNK